MRRRFLVLLLGDRVIWVLFALIALAFLYGYALRSPVAGLVFVALLLLTVLVLLARAYLRPEMRVGASLLALVILVDTAILALELGGVIRISLLFWIFGVVLTYGTLGVVFLRRLDF